LSRQNYSLYAKHGNDSMRPSAGFNLVELMVVITVTGILLAIGIPSYKMMSERAAIKLATNELVDAFSYASSQSMLSGPGQDISIVFASNSPDQWCYGVSSQTSCDCTVSDPNNSVACTVEASGSKQLKVTSSKDYNMQIAIDTAAFLANSARFSSVRRLVQPGDITINSPSYSTRISLNAMGLAHACSDNGLGYLSCD